MYGSRPIKRALISVYDKTGIVDFARALHEEFNIELISTGGTARVLTAAGLPVTLVENITGFPEMMDGRVKTLHPKIHAAILADRDNPDHMRQLAEQGLEPIDMVVVNLYPFEKTVADPNCTFEQAIEMIDIGGPCLLRAAAKNHQHVWVVCERRLLSEFLAMMREEDPSIAFTPEELRETRRTYASCAFARTEWYDRGIHAWLMSVLASETHESFARSAAPQFPGVMSGVRKLAATLRYGENPHQVAATYEDMTPTGLTKRMRLLGGEMSFNNYVDAHAALELCAELTRANLWHRLQTGATDAPPTVCFIKHTNACGSAVDPDPIQAYRKAYLGDPNAAMGGILAVNFPVDAAFAEVVMETYARFGKPLKEAGHPNPPGAFFAEVWLAPTFDEEAVRIIRGQVDGKPQKPWGQRVRLLAVGDLAAAPDPSEMDLKRIAGGMLMQTRDLVGLNEADWKVVTDRQPTDQEFADLRLAWLTCKHTKSNAITICKDGMLIGNGAGQMSRVMSCRIATWLAKENHHDLHGAVAASDAFFPFRDGPDVLADAGVTALIQPGGSKRDEDTIASCNERGPAMIFTGTRHFRH